MINNKESDPMEAHLLTGIHDGSGFKKVTRKMKGHVPPHHNKDHDGTKVHTMYRKFGSKEYN